MLCILIVTFVRVNHFFDKEKRVNVRYETLDYQKTDTLLVLHLFPVKDQNGIVQLSSELRGICTDIAFDPDIRVVVLTGAEEKSFSIAPDMAHPGSEGCEEPGAIVSSFAEPIANLDLPVIATINGDAIGQGMELALACDLRIASESSRFGLPHIQAGLIPWDGGTQRLSRLVGRGKAIEMILTGEMIDAQEALRIGLVNRIIPSEKLTTTVLAMAREMTSKGPLALRYTKEAINKGLDVTLEQGLRLEADLYLLLHTTRDRTEGIQAFREKRVSKFEGK